MRSIAEVYVQILRLDYSEATERSSEDGGDDSTRGFLSLSTALFLPVPYGCGN
jgi:hypothetical protein